MDCGDSVATLYSQVSILYRLVIYWVVGTVGGRAETVWQLKSVLRSWLDKFHPVAHWLKTLWPLRNFCMVRFRDYLLINTCSIKALESHKTFCKGWTKQNAENTLYLLIRRKTSRTILRGAQCHCLQMQLLYFSITRYRIRVWTASWVFHWCL